MHAAAFKEHLQAARAATRLSGVAVELLSNNNHLVLSKQFTANRGTSPYIRVQASSNKVPSRSIGRRFLVVLVHHASGLMQARHPA
jgi:hypothetical protein